MTAKTPIYTHIIAVALECTCWDEQVPVKYRDREIIEFSAVLTNVESGQIEAEFHQFLKPIERPVLSDFCVKITYISQATVDNGVALSEVLKMFHNWLCKELKERELLLPNMSRDNLASNIAFATWTDYDFGLFLDKECKRKNLKKPPYFNQWIEMRQIYRDLTRISAGNFALCLARLGIVDPDSSQTGISKARKLGEMAHRLVVKRGAKLRITKNLGGEFFDINEIM